MKWLLVLAAQQREGSRLVGGVVAHTASWLVMAGMHGFFLLAVKGRRLRLKRGRLDSIGVGEFIGSSEVTLMFSSWIVGGRAASKSGTLLMALWSGGGRVAQALV